MNTFPADVACMGVRRPTQLTVVIVGAPRTWAMLITAFPSRTTRFTVSRTASASCLQAARLSSARSSILVAPSASCTTP